MSGSNQLHPVRQPGLLKPAPRCLQRRRLHVKRMDTARRTAKSGQKQGIVSIPGRCINKDSSTAASLGHRTPDGLMNNAVKRHKNPARIMHVGSLLSSS